MPPKNLSALRNFLSKEDLNTMVEFLKDTESRMAKMGHVTKPSRDLVLRLDDKNDIIDKLLIDATTEGAFESHSNTITINSKLLNTDAFYRALIHELGGHWYRYNMHPAYKPISRDRLLWCYNNKINYNNNINMPDSGMFLQKERNMLTDSYGKLFTGDLKNNINEMGAVNTELRGLIHKKTGKIGAELNKELLSKERQLQFLKYLYDHAYTHDGVINELSKSPGLKGLVSLNDLNPCDLNFALRDKQMQKLIENIQNTTVKVGALSIPIIGGAMFLNNQEKDNKNNQGILIRKNGGEIENSEKPNQSPEETSYTPTLEDLINFTCSYETYKGEPYELKTLDGNTQVLAGYGSSNPRIIELARAGQLTEPMAREEVRRKLTSIYNNCLKQYDNFSNLPIGAQLGILDIIYNGRGIKGTNLEKMILSGETDGYNLSKEMDFSYRDKKWLGARSRARIAMARNEYDWQYPSVDKFGRHVNYDIYKGPEDWRSSPYWTIVLKNGGFLKRIK